jgi:hypothetical protein
MASIKVSELRPTGSELFQDSESFLNELNDRDTNSVLGGRGKFYVGISVSAQTVVGNTYNANTWGNVNTVILA